MVVGSDPVVEKALLVSVLNSAGLICEMLGTALPIKFGLAPNPNMNPFGRGYTILDKSSPKAKSARQKYKLYKRWERTGFIAIFAGAFLQLIATWLSSLYS